MQKHGTHTHTHQHTHTHIPTDSDEHSIVVLQKRNYNDNDNVLPKMDISGTLKDMTIFYGFLTAIPFPEISQRNMHDIVRFCRLYSIKPS